MYNGDLSIINFAVPKIVNIKIYKKYIPGKTILEKIVPCFYLWGVK